MSTIRATVNDQELVITKALKIASGGKGTNFVAFEFCELWDGYSKTAVFFNTPADPYKQTLGIDDICEIPPEVTARKNRMFFGVFGIDGNGNEKTTEVVCYDIAQGAFITGAKPPNPTMEYWEQVLAEIAKNEADIKAALIEVKKVKGSADEAIRIAGSHAVRHSLSGEDPLYPGDIGAARQDHKHDAVDIDGMIESDYDEENETLELGDYFEYEDERYYVPSVSNDGTLSWIPSIEGMEEVPRANIKGPTGVTPKIEIGEVVTVESKEQAAVSCEGTEENPVLNFMIPKGDKGEPGKNLVVRITGSDEDGYTADKTFEEIKAAYDSEVGVYCLGSSSTITVPLHETYMPLNFINGAYIVFTGMTWDYTQKERNYVTQYIFEFEIKPDNTVSFYYGEQAVLPNPAAMSINGESYDGKTEKDFTEAINTMIGDSLTDIKSDIADLKYVPIAVSSFSHNAGTRENGDTVSSVVLSWGLNKEPASVSVDGTAVDAVQNGSVTVEEEIAAKRTFGLKATDERGATATKTATIYFYDGIYYGCAEKPDAVDSEFILSLAKKLSGGKNLTVSATGGDGLYFFYAYPASMGESIFNIGG
ncbi:MAG: hypothetical protein IJ306_01195, partial [Oscillospiraceae bacterium]|nr:hypothetical protein [Oscillospiraceae bacterium]